MSRPPSHFELVHTALNFMAHRDLPARLDVAQAARVLGFSENDVAILMSSGKLSPLGDPAPNAPKWFATIELVELLSDRDWLNKATREVSKYWRVKRQRRIVQLRSDPTKASGPSTAEQAA